MGACGKESGAPSNIACDEDNTYDDSSTSSAIHAASATLVASDKYLVIGTKQGSVIIYYAIKNWNSLHCYKTHIASIMYLINQICKLFEHLVKILMHA